MIHDKIEKLQIEMEELIQEHEKILELERELARELEEEHD